MHTGWSTAVLVLGGVCAVTGVAAAAATPPAAAPSQGRTIEEPRAVLPLRQRAAPVDRILERRLDELLPRLMREAGLDMWLVICRENNEDPVFFTLVPEDTFAARRTTMLVFHDRGEEAGVERLSVSRYPLGGLYEAAWEGGDLDEQWRRLGEIVRQRDPRRIGIDVSADWPVADGLSHGLHQQLVAALGPQLAPRLTTAEELVVRWLESRLPEEIDLYARAVAIARQAIGEAFSARVITPGATTTGDVAWWMRQRFAELDLPVWFHPDVNVQRAGMECGRDAPFCGDDDTVIQRGDVLHTDVGICYLRLCTDTQEMGYVLRVSETAPPPGLVAALAAGNRMQDLVTEAFASGRSGNDTLARALAGSAREGLRATVYSHPIGFFGHAPGPTIGMWDEQGPTPVQGAWPLHAGTAYAIEGNVKAQVPEWEGQWLQVKLEQSAWFDGERVVYLAGRQTGWHLVD